MDLETLKEYENIEKTKNDLVYEISLLFQYFEKNKNGVTIKNKSVDDLAKQVLNIANKAGINTHYVLNK